MPEPVNEDTVVCVRCPRRDTRPDRLADTMAICEILDDGGRRLAEVPLCHDHAQTFGTAVNWRHLCLSTEESAWRRWVCQRGPRPLYGPARPYTGPREPEHPLRHLYPLPAAVRVYTSAQAVPCPCCGVTTGGED